MLEQRKSGMLQLASQLLEFPVVMAMHGVGDSLSPQIMAEIGDVIHLARRRSITSFTDNDSGADLSDSYGARSVRTSKSDALEVRKVLFLVIDCLLKTMPQDDPIYLFIDKKRAEGKLYLIYMTAADANKFLRIDYSRIKEYLAMLEIPSINSDKLT